MKQQDFLDDPELFNKVGPRIELICDKCEKMFERRKSRIKQVLWKTTGNKTHTFCSPECKGQNQNIKSPVLIVE